MPAYVIALMPEKRLYQKIQQLKQTAQQAVGNGLYLTDEPHLTLHIGNFSPLPTFYREWESAFNRNAAPVCAIREWMVFSPDAITNKHTLACHVEKTPELARLQYDVVSFMNRYRQGIIERYRHVQGLGPQEMENLDAYGFPFVGAIWKPHISIGSFDKEQFDRLWPLLKERCPTGLYKFTSIMLYELDQKTDRLTAVKRISLEEDHAGRGKGRGLPGQ